MEAAFVKKAYDDMQLSTKIITHIGPSKFQPPCIQPSNQESFCS